MVYKKTKYWESIYPKTSPFPPKHELAIDYEPHEYIKANKGYIEANKKEDVIYEMINDEPEKAESNPLYKLYTPLSPKPIPIKSSHVPVDVGIRYDDGKLPMHLLPPELLTEVAKVLAFGAKKYAPRNWEKGMDWSRVEASLMRHLIKWKEGEDIDPETGLSHIAHVACNAAFLIAYIKRGVGTDDRPIKDS